MKLMEKSKKHELKIAKQKSNMIRNAGKVGINHAKASPTIYLCDIVVWCGFYKLEVVLLLFLWLFRGVVNQSQDVFFLLFASI